MYHPVNSPTAAQVRQRTLQLAHDLSRRGSAEKFARVLASPLFEVALDGKDGMDRAARLARRAA